MQNIRCCCCCCRLTILITFNVFRLRVDRNHYGGRFECARFGQFIFVFFSDLLRSSVCECGKSKKQILHNYGYATTDEWDYKILFIRRHETTSSKLDTISKTIYSGCHWLVLRKFDSQIEINKNPTNLSLKVAYFAAGVLFLGGLSALKKKISI